MNLDSGVALVGLAELKEYLKITSTETEEDEILKALINSVSGWVQKFVGRKLLQATHTEYYSGDGEKLLILRNWPIQSVTSVHIDSLRQYGSSSAIVVADDVIIRKREGILHAWNLLGNWPCGEANIKVVYLAGYLSDADKTETQGGVPHDIRLAIKRTIDHQYRTGYTHRRLDVKSESVGETNTTFNDGDIPADAKKMLLTYKERYFCPGFVYAD